MGSPGSRAVGPPPDPGLLPLDDSALPEVHGHLPARCGQRALAEDLTAETFLAAVRAGDVPLSVGWLIGTARHELVDHWRRLEREDRGLRLLEGGRPDVEDPWDAGLDALRDREVLDRLGPARRPTGGPAMSQLTPYLVVRDARAAIARRPGPGTRRLAGGGADAHGRHRRRGHRTRHGPDVRRR
jgi:RNA polymerase sigma-70 factor (ECF subfamily)